MSDGSVVPADLEPIQINSLFSQEQLETIWAGLESQITPFVYVLCIDGSLFRMLDAGAKRFIATMFMYRIPETMIYCRDGTGPDRYFLGAPRHFVSGSGMILRPPGTECIWIVRPGGPTPAPVMPVAEDPSTVYHAPGLAGIVLPSLQQPPTATQVEAAPAEKPTKIRRPPNAYILYRKERHSMVKEANPTITNNQISQILGAAWNMESREVRFKYKEMAEKVKQALLAKHPNYQYKPRRPSERQRRARRNPPQAVAQVPVVEQAASSPDSVSENDIAAVDATQSV